MINNDSLCDITEIRSYVQTHWPIESASKRQQCVFLHTAVAGLIVLSTDINKLA
jgi:hypothetical protein